MFDLVGQEICFHFDWLGSGPCPRCGGSPMPDAPVPIGRLLGAAALGLDPRRLDPRKASDDLSKGLTNVASKPLRVASGETKEVELETPLTLAGPYRIGISASGVDTLRVVELRMGNEILTLGTMNGGELPVEHLELSAPPAEGDDLPAWPEGLVPVRGPIWSPGVVTRLRIRNVSCMTEEIVVTVWGRRYDAAIDIGSVNNETQSHLVVDLAGQVRDWRKKHAHLSDRIAQLNTLLEASETSRRIAQRELEAREWRTPDGIPDEMSHEMMIIGPGGRQIRETRPGPASRLAAMQVHHEAPHEPRLGWFGTPWSSPICNTRPARAMPPGECLGCGCIFRDGDSGVTIMDRASELPFHKRCFPAWIKQNRLPLDIRAVADAAAGTRDNGERRAYEADRVASMSHEADLLRGYEPGEVWENPSWDE